MSFPSDNDHHEGHSPWASATSPINPQSFASNNTNQAQNHQQYLNPNISNPGNHEDRDQPVHNTSSPTDQIQQHGSHEPMQSTNVQESEHHLPENLTQTSITQNQTTVPEQNPQHPVKQTTRRPRQASRPTSEQYRLQCKITALERNGRKDPILRFDAYTNLPKFRTTQFRDIRRTHSEFQKLADHLISSNPEAMVPAVPPPVTSAGAGTDEDETRVKGSIQRWLNVVCSNVILMRDEELVFFIESDFGYSPVLRNKQPATGVRRKYIKQFAPPPDDTPELLDARPLVKGFYLGAMDAGMRVDKIVKSRRALGLAESSIGHALSQLTTTESHPGLTNAYRKLSRTLQTVSDIHSAQSTGESTVLGDPLAYHTSDALIVKETLTNRHILLRELLSAQQTAFSREASANRLKTSSSVKRDKVDEAIHMLDEARAHEQHLADKTRAVTVNLLQDKKKWFARTSTDLRSAIREYVLRQIESERRTLATLELVRPDVRNIDSSGGLSRLGRENFNVRRNVGSSQGPKGDAWSGVARRADVVSRSVEGGMNGPVDENDNGEGRRSRRGTMKNNANKDGDKNVDEDDDEDRIDAKNAASRLATATF